MEEKDSIKVDGVEIKINTRFLGHAQFGFFSIEGGPSDKEFIVKEISSSGKYIKLDCPYKKTVAWYPVEHVSIEELLPSKED